MVTELIRKVYYNSWADKNVYDMIREVMPPGFELADPPPGYDSLFTRANGSLGLPNKSSQP